MRRRMMTGWFNAALAKIKGLSDKYHGRLRDCSLKSHSELLTNLAGAFIWGVGFLASEQQQSSYWGASNLGIMGPRRVQTWSADDPSGLDNCM